MRLLDRYLLRELLAPLTYCLCGFLLIWIIGDLSNGLGNFQANKLRSGDILLYYLVKAPDFLIFVFPIALLLTLLYALTNHARHHEITAIRAAGVSLWRLAAPYFAVGCTASAVLFVVNEFWVPDSAEYADRVLNRRLDRQKNPAERNLVRDLGFINARERRAWQIGAYNLLTFEMTSPKVIWILPDGSRRWLSADRAIRTNDVWVFLNAREFREDPGTNSALVPWLKANALPLPEFTETPDEIRSEVKISEYLNVTLRVVKKADIPILEIVNYLRFHPNPPPKDRWWLYTKLHGRLAAPWTCLVVVFIALPFGAASGRRNVYVGVASSILLCFGYYVLLQIGLALGTGGYVPAWLAAWSPNLIFAVTGLWLTARVR